MVLTVRHPYANKIVITMEIALCPTPVHVKRDGQVTIAPYQFVLKIVTMVVSIILLLSFDVRHVAYEQAANVLMHDHITIFQLFSYFSKNEGVCVAPDTCQCYQWENRWRDGQAEGGVPLFQTVNGDPQLTGWT